jgi:hypothetical protein
MLLNVHTNLKALAAVCGEHDRFSAGCVRLIDPGNGLYRAEATDGRILAIVQGPSDGIGGTDPNPDLTEALIPADEWAAGLALDKKAKQVLVGSVGDDQPDVNFASLTQIRRVRQGEGRWPDVGRVIPSQTPLFSVLFDPAHLIRLLRLFQAFAAETERRVALHYYGPKGFVLGFSARNGETGQVLDALLVPLVIKDD